MTSLFSLQGKVAVCTGASSGIGRAIAVGLAGAGADVALVSRNRDNLEETKAIITQNQPDATQKIALFPTDLSDAAKLPQLVRDIIGTFGAPRIIVNASALNHRADINALSPEQWHETLQLNLTAPFFLTQALVPHLRGAGGGSIINIGSLQSLRAGAGDAAYGASKAGLLQLTRAMAKNWGQYHIRANAIIPGFIPTKMTESVLKNPAVSEKVIAATFLGRLGQCDDFVGVAVFLASEASCYITGEAIAVDGGLLAN